MKSEALALARDYRKIERKKNQLGKKSPAGRD